MNTLLSPIVSEFETEEAANAYDTWFRAKVQKSMDSREEGIPHDQAMAMLDEELKKRKDARANR
ncbi:MAG: hypothetical protein Q8J66_04590 [Methylotenera sp.]|nr:hypothetical protein [Methylotenera sp.]